MSKVTSSINIPQPSIFGRLGTGIGQGLAEQLPKEIERARLGSALDQLGKQQGLDPWQQYTGLVKAAHEYPQVVQSGADILRQRGISQGFRNIPPNGASSNAQNQPGQTYQQGFNQPGMQSNAQFGGDSPQKGIATVGPTQATLHPYIPKTLQQLQGRAGQLQQEHPEIYPTADLAMKGAVQEDQQEQAINTALQGQRKGEQAVQENVRSQLSALKNASNAAGVPENVYQPIEDQALEDVRLGRKDELTASKDARKKLEDINREYDGVKRIGIWNKPSEMHRSIESLRQDFKKRNDLENFADTLVGQSGLSYPISYYKTFPVEDYPEVNDVLKHIKGPSIETYKRGLPNPSAQERPTLEAAEKIAPLLSKSGASPLSISQNLKMKGLNPEVFLDYLVKHKWELDLSERQNRELEKQRDWFPKLADIMLMYGLNESEALE